VESQCVFRFRILRAIPHAVSASPGHNMNRAFKTNHKSAFGCGICRRSTKTSNIIALVGTAQMTRKPIPMPSIVSTGTAGSPPFDTRGNALYFFPRELQLLNLVATFRQFLAMSSVASGATGRYALHGVGHRVGVSGTRCIR
jgi:hypothetical protein